MSTVCLIKSNEIVNGSNLFESDDNIVTWDSDLELLENGYKMFYICGALTDFRAATPNLKNGHCMFCANCTMDDRTIRFSSESLENGEHMFNDGTGRIGTLHLRSNNTLESFWKFPKLKNGQWMFSGTKTYVYQMDDSNGVPLHGYVSFPTMETGACMFYNYRFTDGNSFWLDDVMPKCVNFYGMFASSNLQSFGCTKFFDGLNGQEFGNSTPLRQAYDNLSSSDEHYSFGANYNYFASFSDMFENCHVLESFEGGIASLSGSTRNNLSTNGIECNKMFRNCSKLTTVQFGDGLMDGVKSAYGMFQNCEKLQEFTPNNSQGILTDVRYMFENCTSLKHVKIDMRQVTSHYRTFYNCTNLETFYGGLSSLTDGTSMFEGCSKLTTFTSDLSSLSDGTNMFYNCRNLATFTSDSSGSPVNLSSLTNGQWMFSECSKLTTFYSDLSSLANGYYMFSWCENLTTFDSDLSSLTNGTSMFYGCSNLTSFTSDLSSLNYGYWMFYYCTALTAFTSDLSSLTNGDSMFSNCENLTTFTSDLSSLTNGASMFQNCENLTTFTSDSSGSPVNLSSLTNGTSMFSSCSNLNTFTSDLSSLTNGYCMFCGCSKLTTFTSDLRSLTNGYCMFQGCKLNATSLASIANTINDVNDKSSSPVINIGTEHSFDNLTVDEKTSLATIINKGWTVHLDNYGSVTLEDLGIFMGSVYDIVEGSPYIPDASSWNSDFTSEGIISQVTSVHDGFAWTNS